MVQGSELPATDGEDGLGETAASRPMKPLQPAQLQVLRIRFALFFLFLIAIAVLVDLSLISGTPVPAGLLSGLLCLLSAAGLIILPGRRYRAWSWLEEEDELHIRHGLWVRTFTVVPFARVQHIDVAQGPIERRFDLARLILHTAGTRGPYIGLPGLLHEEAEALRDRIRARIRQDLL
jgi:membrane protein YdbS with pleckstrin-like domain